MVLVKFEDCNSNPVRVEAGTNSRIPNAVSRIQIGVSDDIDEAYDDEEDDDKFIDLDYEVLIRMLRGLSVKVRTICIKSHDARSPSYLALLLTSTRCAHLLEILSLHEDPDSEIVFAILAGGILRGGPSFLSLNYIDFPSHQAAQVQVFFESVGRSSCLETLQIVHVCFEDDEAATTSFVAALMENRSLKSLIAENTEFTNYPEIFRAAILNTKVREIEILGKELERAGRLDWRNVSQILNSEDCKLEYLCLSYLNMVTNDSVDNRYEVNTSVKEVELKNMNLQDADLNFICSIFKSATNLNLECNQFLDLAPLDSLLIGNNLKLQHLSLSNCGIDEDSIVAFFRKLPRMACIQRIDLRGNPFLTNSHEWRDLLLNMVQQNASLELISISTDNEDRRAFYSRLDLAFGTNRAWSRHMENDSAEHSSKALPSTLWPLVLERATRISYFSCGGRYATPQISKADVVFWLVKERMAAELPFTP